MHRIAATLGHDVLLLLLIMTLLSLARRLLPLELATDARESLDTAVKAAATADGEATYQSTIGSRSGPLLPTYV